MPSTRFNHYSKQVAFVICALCGQGWTHDVKPVWISQPMYRIGQRQPRCTPPHQTMFTDFCRDESEVMVDFIDYLNQEKANCHFSNPRLVGSYRGDFLLSDRYRNPQALAHTSDAQQFGIYSYAGTRAVLFDSQCTGPESYPLSRITLTKYRAYRCPQGYFPKRGYNRNNTGLRYSDRDLGDSIQWPYLCTPASMR